MFSGEGDFGPAIVDTFSLLDGFAHGGLHVRLGEEIDGEVTGGGPQNETLYGFRLAADNG